MRGGQYVNNWRMAELHAKEAPDRVRELEAWGALFDRTADGRILQRNFGGHRYPRLAHVGDRTGLEMIRTLQDHGIHRGLDVHMEFTVVTLLLDGGRVAGALRLRARARPLQGVPRQGGRARHRRHRPRLSGSPATAGKVHGDGHALAYRAGAELIDMEFVQFHPTGMVWPPSVQGILVTEGVRGEGGVLRNSEGPPLHVRRHPGQLPQPDRRQRGRGLALHPGRQERAPSARAAHPRPRRPLHHARGQGGRGSPHGGVFLDISWIKEKLPNAPEHIRKKLPSMYHQFKQLADIDITTRSRWRSARRRTT